jgi:hypothetical protein
MNSRKGQSLSFDAIIASVIFIITLFSFLNFLFYFQNTGDYNKDIMEKEAVRISILLFSENDTYGIMEDTMTNRLIPLIPDDGIKQRIANISSTTPYSICLKVNMTMYNCRDESLSQKVTMSRIVRTNEGDPVPLTIWIYQKQ